MNKRKFLLAVASVFALVGLLTISVPGQAQTAVFINEIHYDNASTDTGEALEVAGPAGTDLAGWRLVLYNGNGGAVYDTIALSGVLPDQQNGFGTLAFFQAGIQNGSPDGVALVDASDSVVQFLSYEGAFTAAGGLADGMLSTDIGVAESSSTLVGESLQLTGSGTEYEDFSWAEAGPNTFGAVNNGQTFASSPAVPELVINEIIQNPNVVSDSAGEWLELYNPTAVDIDIDGWTLSDNDSDSHVIANGGPLVVPAGGYLVLGNNTDLATNGGAPVAYSYGGNWFLSNSADEVVLTAGNGSEIDRVEYDNGATFPDPNGASMALLDPALDNNTGANWCESTTPFGAGDLGTPGAANDCQPAPAPELVINEIIQNPNVVSDSAGEWLELYNPTAVDIDIDGWTLSDNDSDSHVIANGGPLLVPAGGYLVLGNNTDLATNGGAPVAYSYGSSWFLSNSADEVVLTDGNDTEIDRVEYDNGATFPDPNGASMALLDPALDNNVGANWCESTTPFGAGDLGTPGDENTCEIVIPPLSCDDASVITPIHTIQGSDLASALDGMPVVIEGVVVGDFQEADGDQFATDLDGFYLQEEDADTDGDPLTSEGIFVFAPGALDVVPGDQVRVAGTVDEFSDLTELNEVTGLAVCGSGNAVSPSLVTLPVADANDLEAFEGMLVTFPQDLTISEFFNFDRYNEVVLTVDRAYQPTAVEEPGSAEGAALLDLNMRSRITLDDARTTQNPPLLRHPNGDVFDLTNRFRGGDLMQGVTGVLDYRFDLYRIQPTSTATYVPQNPRPAPVDVGGRLQVASFNVLNYFTTLDNSGSICGPLEDQGCRGADNAEEFTRQRTKIIAAISAMDADIVGLIEIENHPGDVPTADLVNGLNDVLGAGTYDYIPTGAIGSDVIRVAFIYKPAAVSPVGSFAVLDSAVDSRFNDEKNRPVLAQAFQENFSGGTLTVAVNHFKSKGSSCDDVGDPNTGDGSGNCNLTRLAAAQALVDWLPTDPTGSGDGDFLIIGDLNSYDKEDPIDAVLAGADDILGTGDDYADLLALFGGEFAYSYVFSGELGYLDYALANVSLTPQVTGTAAWHINADEPDILDYDTSFKPPEQDALYEPNEYRASDHDPVLIGLDLNGPPNCTKAYASIDTLWPANHQMVAIDILGVIDPDGDAITITIDSIFQDEPVMGSGDGNTGPDGDGVGTAIALVRAERDGGGNGRYYHITFTATDSLGNSCSGVVLVSVPKNQGKKGAAVDDGPLYDSTIVP